MEETDFLRAVLQDRMTTHKSDEDAGERERERQ